MVFADTRWSLDFCTRAESKSTSSSTISIISARQKLICSHSSAPSLKVGCSSDSPFLLFPNRRNHAGFVIRVELGPSAQFRLTGSMLELLRFNDEPRGDPSLSPVTHTPKFTAQQQTSVLCRFRRCSRWGLTVCQAECTSFEAQNSSRCGFATDPCWLAPFSAVRLFQEDCFCSSVNPPFSRVALLLSIFYPWLCNGVYPLILFLLNKVDVFF